MCPRVSREYYEKKETSSRVRQFNEAILYGLDQESQRNIWEFNKLNATIHCILLHFPLFVVIYCMVWPCFCPQTFLMADI